ncbi:MAG: hypothetical protein LIP09_04330 [Bacteroidales bacterium]|nr:hypothetical protein [Bacteroidales bacterium]
MSVAAIVLGLLIWFSFPALYRNQLNYRGMRFLSSLCRVVGIVVICGGILYGVL